MKKTFKKLIGYFYKSHIPFLLNRGEIAAILNARGLVGQGAEVGVKHGQFSEFLLDHWNGRILFSIDPWREFEISVYHDGDNVSQNEQDRNYEITANRLARFGTRSVLMRMTSEEAAGKIPDRSLDFVYLDARHDYESVKEDIHFWYPKVKPGGIMAGHDYMTKQISGTIFGVKQAVDEFSAQHGLPKKVSLREPVYKSWLIEKPIA